MTVLETRSPLLRMTEEFPTDYWNDSCARDELAYAVERGAVGATSNPTMRRCTWSCIKRRSSGTSRTSGRRTSNCCAVGHISTVSLRRTCSVGLTSTSLQLHSGLTLRFPSASK